MCVLGGMAAWQKNETGTIEAASLKYAASERKIAFEYLVPFAVGFDAHRLLRWMV